MRSMPHPHWKPGRGRSSPRIGCSIGSPDSPAYGRRLSCGLSDPGSRHDWRALVGRLKASHRMLSRGYLRPSLGPKFCSRSVPVDAVVRPAPEHPDRLVGSGAVGVPGLPRARGIVLRSDVLVPARPMEVVAVVRRRGRRGARPLPLGVYVYVVAVSCGGVIFVSLGNILAATRNPWMSEGG